MLGKKVCYVMLFSVYLKKTIHGKAYGKDENGGGGKLWASRGDGMVDSHAYE